MSNSVAPPGMREPFELGRERVEFGVVEMAEQRETAQQCARVETLAGRFVLVHPRPSFARMLAQNAPASEARPALILPRRLHHVYSDTQRNHRHDRHQSAARRHVAARVSRRSSPNTCCPPCKATLADHRRRIDALTADAQPRSFATTMLPQEAMDYELQRIWSPVNHLHSVADTEALRAAHAEAEQLLSEYSAEMGQNRELFAAVKAASDNADFAALPLAARTLVDHALRDFKLSGVSLEEPARSRFREIVERTHAPVHRIRERRARCNRRVERTGRRDPRLPEFPTANSACSAMGTVLSSRSNSRASPPCSPTPTIARCANVFIAPTKRGRRIKVRMRASSTIPRAWRRSSRCVTRRRRCSASRTRPKNRWRRRWRARPDRVLDFLRDLVQRAKPIAERELAELREFAREHVKLDDLQPWDVSYCAEKLRAAEIRS